MPNFHVIVTAYGYFEDDVEADSEEDAYDVAIRVAESEGEVTWDVESLAESTEDRLDAIDLMRLLK